MRRKILAAAAITAVALATLPAKAQERVEVGTLNCQVAGGTGFVFGSSKALDCELRTVSGLTEQYVGEIKKFGIDIGSTSESVIVWGVLAPTRDIPPDMLRGVYRGVSAEATVGVGVGANALVGGNSESIVLQPVSVSAQSGLNIAAGVSSIELRAAN